MNMSLSPSTFLLMEVGYSLIDYYTNCDVIFGDDMLHEVEFLYEIWVQALPSTYEDPGANTEHDQLRSLKSILTWKREDLNL